MEIAKIERVLLRDAWKHEALDFTKWLQANLDYLADSIGLRLTAIESEHQVGDFSVDLLAKDDAGSLVVIENQLERSDHDHLGKLVTYASMVGARSGIWIVALPRPEHVKAIQWLNEGMASSFYLVKLEAVRIGDSPTAPLFTIITGPSEGSAEAGRVRAVREKADNQQSKFWAVLLDRARLRTQLHKNISPGTQSWVGTTADLPRGISFNYATAFGKGRVELYIDDDKRGKDFNEEVLAQLASQRTVLEQAYGRSLEWQDLPDGRACRICEKFSTPFDLKEESTWSLAIDEMIDGMIRLEKVLRPHLRSAADKADRVMRERLTEVAESEQTPTEARAAKDEDRY